MAAQWSRTRLTDRLRNQYLMDGLNPAELVDLTATQKPAKDDAGPDVVNHGTARKSGQYLAAVCATFGAFALGNSMAWSSPAGLPMRNGTYIEGVKLTDVEESWAGALMPLGAAVFAFPIGFLMEAIGRRISMLILVVPYTVGWGLLIWPTTVEFLYLGRFLVGLAGGAVSVAAPIYTAEIAQVEIRGALGSYFEMMLTLGIVFVYAVGSVTSVFVLSIVCGVVPLVFAAAFFFMPETPVYCVSKKRDEEAKKALLFLRGPNYNIEAELLELQDLIATTRKDTKPIYTELTSRAVVRSLVISLGLMALQQLSAVDAVTFYTNNIFDAAGSELDPDISSIIMGSIECIATFLSSLVVDRLGRKILLIVSSAVMAVCTLLLGVFFYLKETGEDVSELGWLPLVSLCLYMVAFALGLGPIPWTMVGELFTSRIRSAASGAASLVNWGTAFIVTKFYSDMVSGLGGGPTFWIFAGILVLCTGFCIFVVKETKGKTVEEIQEELGRR